MELIDRAELKKVPMFNGKYDKEHANEHFIYGIESVMEYIEQMPTIDPVHAAGGCYCRECLYFDGEYCEDGSYLFVTRTDPDDFCSRGVRRDVDATN